MFEFHKLGRIKTINKIPFKNRKIDPIRTNVPFKKHQKSLSPLP